MKKILALALLFCFVSAGVAMAATLDELNDPLLKKGQWRTDQQLDIEYNAESSRYDTLTTDTYSDETETTYGFEPALYYGLSDTLQVGVNGFFGIPYKSNSTTYIEGDGAQSTSTNKLRYYNFIQENLLWRPSQSWEVRFNPSQGFQKGDGYNINYGPINTGISSGIRMELFQFSSGVTWLSNPQPGNKTTNNRADLDGLINPLLDKGQVELALNMFNSMQKIKMKMNQDPPLSPVTFGRQLAKGKSYGTSLNPVVTYGILGNLQVDLDTLFMVPAFSHSRSNSSSYTVIGPTVQETYSEYTSKVVSDYDPVLTLTHRPHPQFQWYAQGEYSYEKTRNNNVMQMYANGILVGTNSDTSRNTSKEQIASIGATWISKPEGEGRPLSADLDGLKNPLLERNQVRVDLSFEARRYWDKTSDSSSHRVSNCGVSTTVTYGILDALQAYLGFDLNPEYSYPQDSGTSHYNSIYPTDVGYRVGLTYRPKQTFEFFAQAEIMPNSRYKGESYSSGVLTSVSNGKDLGVEAEVGATILW